MVAMKKDNQYNPFFVAYPTKHALVRHDSHCEEVDGRCVVLAAHNLGRHVARRARCVLSVLFSPHPRNSKISDSQVAYCTERNKNIDHDGRGLGGHHC